MSIIGIDWHASPACLTDPLSVKIKPRETSLKPRPPSLGCSPPGAFTLARLLRQAGVLALLHASIMV
jgi:hypothetical protein